MPRLTLALAQINTRLGDVQAKLEKHLGLVEEARAQGADLMLVISASPGRGLNQGGQLESARWVEQINQAYTGLFTAFVAHTNRVGFEDGLNFWAGATVFDPDGRPIAHGPYHQEALTVAELDLGQLHRTRVRLPLLRNERTAMVQRELRRILDCRLSGNRSSPLQPGSPLPPEVGEHG
jgi:predicted amidohydrolase